MVERGVSRVLFIFTLSSTSSGAGLMRSILGFGTALSSSSSVGALLLISFSSSLSSSAAAIFPWKLSSMASR